jgi:hypothetical protein
MIEQNMLKKRPGNYDELWKERFSEALRHRDDYANSPFQAAVQVNENYLIRNKANPPWDFEKYEDILHLFVFLGMKIYILRASKEVRQSKDQNSPFYSYDTNIYALYTPAPQPNI